MTNKAAIDPARAAVDEAASSEMLAVQAGWPYRFAVSTSGAPILLTEVDDEPYTLYGLVDICATINSGGTETIYATWWFIAYTVLHALDEAMHGAFGGEIFLAADNGDATFYLPAVDAAALLRAVLVHAEKGNTAA